MKRLLWKCLQLLKGRDKGTSAITFLMSLPILMTVVGVLVQYTLLANAKLTVNRALQAAARSAMTALPTDQAIGQPGGRAYPERSALMTLESLSPASPDASQDGITIADALNQVGANPPANYAARYAYAQSATRLDIVPVDANGNLGAGLDCPRAAALRVRMTLTYHFQLTVPILKDVIGRTDTIGGITGRFFTFTSTVDAQLSPGREAWTDASGQPTGAIIFLPQ